VSPASMSTPAPRYVIPELRFRIVIRVIGLSADVLVLPRCPPPITPEFFRHSPSFHSN